MSGDWHKVGNVKGADGVGVPRGGARGDVLKKEGGADHATSWGKVSYADIEGKVPAAALPEIGTAPYVVDSESAMLNLPAVPGRQAIRTDIGATFVLAEEPASTLENWVEMVSRSDVTSVNSKTGSVVLTKADLGLENVDNTADPDKPLATTTVPGLMPHTDKVKLDNATPNASASRLVQRDASGRFSVQPPTSGPHPASKDYVDTKIDNSFLGQGRVDGESWNNIRSTVSAVVDEDAPIGSPTYAGAYDSGSEIPFGFNKVWLLDVTNLGLDYIKQRAQILRAAPTYLVGFAWERIWDPSASHWTNWTTVSGTTGPLPTTHPTTQGGIENIEVSPLSLSTNMIPFSGGVPIMMTRTLDTVHIRGQLTPRLDSFGDALRSGDGLLALYMAGRGGTTPLGFFSAASARASSGVQQGSYRYRWYLNGTTGGDHPLLTRWRAARHDADAANINSGTWLPITLSYSVRTPGVVGTANPGDGEGDESSGGGTEG